MNGEITLLKHLLNDTNVTAVVDTYNGAPCIDAAVKAPEDWPITNSVITIYNALGMDNRDKRMIVTLTVNCRGATEVICKQIASAVVTSTNRVTFTGGGRFYCQTGFVIQPQDDLDSFNIPVEVTMKAGEVVA